jgi:proteasome lid subunit RPN8/RPN11
LARAPSPGRVNKQLVPAEMERCWTLIGRVRGRIWYGRRVRQTDGQRTRVTFDGLWTLEREEQRRDVLGFLHTHPDGPPSPSTRDVRTMRAWCSSFGKPLLCLIQSPEGLKGYRFKDSESEGMELELVELFPRGIVIGVEADGEQVPS